MFEFWREATAASVPGFLCQSGRRRPENVSILSSLLRIQGDGVWCLLLTSCHDYFLSSLIGSRKSFQVNFSVQKCTYQCTFWYQIQRGEKQTRGKGTCVYRPLAIARVCTPAGPQKALGYDPWSTEGYESLSGEENTSPVTWKDAISETVLTNKLQGPRWVTGY